MKELLIIPCSKLKLKRGLKALKTREVGSELSKKNREELRILREKIRKSCFKDTENLYLKAIERYQGILFRKIDTNSILELQNNTDIDMVIISAHYGLIYWDEAIVEYELSMKDKIDGMSLWRWWNEKNLSKYLLELISRKKYKIVRSFLSGLYKKALQGLEEKISKDVALLQYEYTGLGVGSNFYRGIDVNNAIKRKNVTCISKKCNSMEIRRISKTLFKCSNCGKIIKFQNLYRTHATLIAN